MSRFAMLHKALCEPAKQRRFLEELVQRFPGEFLADEARRQLAAPGK